MNRISEDVSKVRMYIGPAIMYTINTFSLFIIVITYMISVAPKPYNVYINASSYTFIYYL